jgi:SH3-like domain-containing protein
MAMRLRAAILVLGMVAALPAAALEYLSIAEPALAYDSPSRQGTPMYAFARGTPVEAIVVLDAWVKVRDAKGELTWIEKRQLSEKRMLIVRAERAQVRVQPDDAAPLVFEAERDVVLEYVELGPIGWVKVQHRGGQQGYVKVAQIWGL